MSLLRTAQNLLERHAFRPYAHAFALLKAMHSKRLQAYYVQGYGVKSLSALSPDRFKTSETLFVLGSGASVNEYGKEEWAAIRSVDSMGFNFWLVHDFVPDVYVIEPPRAPRDVYLYELLVQRASDYVGVPFILKASDSACLDLDRVPSQLLKHLYVSKSMPLPGSSIEHIEQAYANYSGYGLFTPGHRTDTIVQQRASLSGLLHLAVVWGYKRVVLGGVDLNNTAYFYDEERDYFECKGRTVPTTGQLGGVHKTMDASLSSVTVDRVINVMNNVVLKPHGVELLVALSSSALHPALPALFR